MKFALSFVAKFSNLIVTILNCFDRFIFKGPLHCIHEKPLFTNIILEYWGVGSVRLLPFSTAAAGAQCGGLQRRGKPTIAELYHLESDTAEQTDLSQSLASESCQSTK